MRHGRKIIFCMWRGYPFRVPETMKLDVYIYLFGIHKILTGKRLAAVYLKNIVLLHHSTKLHKASITQENKLELGCYVLTQTPHSPALVPTERYLLDRCKAIKWGKISLIKTRFKISLKAFSQKRM